LVSLGVAAVHLDGETPNDERRRILEDHKNGRINVICNVSVLTEGYDDPSVECIVIARPTKSQLLYIQCVGRGLRPGEGKSKLLVLDFASHNHSLAQLADLDGELNLERLKSEIKPIPGWSQVFVDAVLMSLSQRRAILHFTAGNAYTKAIELLKHPNLAWGIFGDCAILSTSDSEVLFIMSPQKAMSSASDVRGRLISYAKDGYHLVLSVPLKKGEVKIVGTGYPDDIVEMASGYAEGVAKKLADGTARWRHDPASFQQMNLLHQLGVETAVLEGINKGEAASIISYVKACNRLGVKWQPT